MDPPSGTHPDPQRACDFLAGALGPAEKRARARLVKMASQRNLSEKTIDRASTVLKDEGRLRTDGRDWVGTWPIAADGEPLILAAVEDET